MARPPRVITRRIWGRVHLDATTLALGGDLRLSITSLLKGHMPSLAEWTIQRMLLKFAFRANTGTDLVVTVGAIVHPEQVTITQVPKPDLDDADWFFRVKVPVISNVNDATIHTWDIRSQRRGREFEAAASLLFSESASASAVTIWGGGIVLFGLH